MLSNYHLSSSVANGCSSDSSTLVWEQGFVLKWPCVTQIYHLSMSHCPAADTLNSRPTFSFTIGSGENIDLTNIVVRNSRSLWHSINPDSDSIAAEGSVKNHSDIIIVTLNRTVSRIDEILWWLDACMAIMGYPSIPINPAMAKLVHHISTCIISSVLII